MTEKIKQKPGRKPGGPKLTNAEKCARYQQRQREKLARLKIASAPARELFPPMAKPLVWRNEGHGSGIISQDILRQRYDISPLRDNFLLHFGDDSSSERIGARFDTIEGAKAAAQSHHQARFLELLA